MSDTGISSFFTKNNSATLVLCFCFAMLLLFALVEREMLAEVAAGRFPGDLFLSILPIMITTFLFGSGWLSLHYWIVALLLSVYVMLLLIIFVERRAFSASSFSTSVLGLIGISLGVSCLSCGAIAGVILASLFGVGVSSFFLIFEGVPFLIVGELFLCASIWLILRAIQRIN